MLKKNSTLLKKKNTEINKTIKVMDQAYARLKMTNDHLKTQLDKALEDVEELKDKVRANGNGHQ